MATATEQKIIAVTIQMIQQEGYQGISLRKVADRAGVTTGAIYTHFKDKKELFYQTSLQIHQVINQQFNLTSQQSAFERLERVVQTLCRLFQDEPQEMEFIYFNPLLIQCYRQRAVDFPFIQLTRSLSHDANPGRLTDEQFFNQIWSFIQGYGLLVKNQLAKYDPQLVGVTVHQLCQQ